MYRVVLEAVPTFTSMNWLDQVNIWRPAGMLQCFPIFSMALACQTNVFEVIEKTNFLTLKWNRIQNSCFKEISPLDKTTSQFNDSKSSWRIFFYVNDSHPDASYWLILYRRMQSFLTLLVQTYESLPGANVLGLRNFSWRILFRCTQPYPTHLFPRWTKLSRGQWISALDSI